MAHPKPVKFSLTGFYLRNIAANLSGNFIIAVLNFFSPLAVFEEWRKFLIEGGWIAIPVILVCIVMVGIFFQYLVQRPITALLEMIHRGEGPEIDLQDKKIIFKNIQTIQNRL